MSRRLFWIRVSSLEVEVMRGNSNRSFGSSNVDSWPQFTGPASRGRRTHCNGAPPRLRLWSGAGGEKSCKRLHLQPSARRVSNCVFVCVCIRHGPPASTLSSSPRAGSCRLTFTKQWPKQCKTRRLGCRLCPHPPLPWREVARGAA